jgi:hypothetical protein
VGDALIALLDWAWPRVVPRLDEWREKISDAVRPDPPISIRTTEGLLLTGLIVADQGRVLLLIGMPSAPSAACERPRREPSPRGHDADGPTWTRDVESHDTEGEFHGFVDPYRR